MLNANILKEKLEEAGLRIVALQSKPGMPNIAPDFAARADLDGHKIELLIEVKERPHLADLRLAASVMKDNVGPRQVPMVACHFMGPNRRALLKEMGIGYVDMAGNIYLRAPGVLIEREVKRNPFGYEHKGLNCYSDKASIVLRVLMNAPGRRWGIREIAEAGNISPGWVSRVVDSLVERGLVGFSRREGVTLLRGEDMLNEWSEVYDWRRSRFYHYYCHGSDVREVLARVKGLKLHKEGVIALGFHSGAYLVSPHSAFNQLHLLLHGPSFDAIRPDIERQLELKPGEEGANLVLVRPYYRHSALFGARRIEDWWVASDVQLYLDLNRYPLRGREQADHLLEKVIRPGLRKEP